jgi:hypothetical protein
MGTIKVVAIALIVAGIFSLLHSQFSYTRETQEAKIGALELSVKDIQTVYIPVWVSVAAMVAGGGFLLFASRKN